MYQRFWNAIVFSILSLNAVQLAAIGLEGLVGNEVAQKLVASGSVKRTDVRGTDLTMLPDSAFARDLVEAVKDGLKPNMTIEALYLLQKPASAASRSWTEPERRAIFNATRALGTLTGIQYYSASRKTMRTFYESSTVIDNPENKSPLPDPVLETIPDQALLYAKQKDLTFGENIYQYTYFSAANAIAFVQKNESSMNYGLVPLLGKGKLRSVVVILDTEDALVVYAVSMVRSFTIPGIEGKIRSSFSNRADAVYSWFSQRALTVLSATSAD